MRYIEVGLKISIVEGLGTKPSGGQHMTWQWNMKSLTEGLSRVGTVR